MKKKKRGQIHVLVLRGHDYNYASINNNSVKKHQNKTGKLLQNKNS